VTITPTDEGLSIEVRDPGEPARGGEGEEWAEVSTIAASWGGRRTRDGHVAWAQLRAAQAGSGVTSFVTEQASR
jgi:hypothetical protein